MMETPTDKQRLAQTFTPETIRQQLIEGGVINTPFGERRITYADYIASGRSLRWIEDRINSHVLPLYANTHTEDSATGAHSTRLTHWAGQYIKQQLGASQFSIIFCGTGCTAAIKRMQEILGMTVPSTLRQRVLDTFAPHERPVVFVGPYEHHSNEVSWRESLAEVVEVPLGSAGGIDLDALETALMDPRFVGRPKMGSFSAASNVTGVMSNTRAVASLLHSHDALAFFDFAASAPYVQIDMKPGEPDGFDAIFISAHKLLGGPGTPGILVFDPALYHQSSPTTAGGGTVSYVNRSEHQFFDDIEVREDAGTPAIIGKVRAALAFAVKDAVGADVIREHEHAYISRALTRLRNNERIELLGSPDADRLAVLSFLVRTSDGSYLHPRLAVRLLNDLFGIQSRGGCACAGPYGHVLLHIPDDMSERYRDAMDHGFVGVKPGWTRLNLNYFICEDEYEFLLSAIEFLAEHGEKFVSEYQFDWSTGAWSHPEDIDTFNAFDYFNGPAPVECCEPVPYQWYLKEALKLADARSACASRPVPEGLAQELVFFRS
jgi:selenocysteine lyase/cysteine desulfurase